MEGMDGPGTGVHSIMHLNLFLNRFKFAVHISLWLNRSGMDSGYSMVGMRIDGINS